jgi:D-threo-aldose 1-dehydrogenase
MSQIGDYFSRRLLGTTGLQVTPLSVGTAALGDMPEVFAYEVTEDEATGMLKEAFNGGINFIDTAASYGDGESERRIGNVLREIGGLPQGWVIGTKADRDLINGDFSGAQMRRSIERSLDLLGLERLQLVHLHDAEHSTYEAIMAPGGPVEVLQSMKEEGLIDHLGVAGGPIDQEIRYVETGNFEVVVTHNRFTLLNRSAEPLLEIAALRNVAVLNAAPYGSGILSRGPKAYPRYAYQDADDDVVRRVYELERICDRYQVPLAAVSLQFSLRDPRITSTIVGASRSGRIEQTLVLAAHEIPEEIWPELDKVAPTSLDPEVHRWN